MNTKRIGFIFALGTFLGLVTALAATAQTIERTLHPRYHLGIRDTAQIERSVEIDGDPATQDFVLADYSTFPTRRAITQLRADMTLCTGPWEYWFGDDPYVWPTYITLNGKTKVTWTVREHWVIMALDIPWCDSE